MSRRIIIPSIIAAAMWPIGVGAKHSPETESPRLGEDCANALPLQIPDRSPSELVKFSLTNGVRVILKPESANELVAICVFVRAGVAEDEAYGSSGAGAVLARAI